MKKTCDECGHDDHRHYATASRNGGERRYFCHENDHSCYNDRRGKYFPEDVNGSIRELSRYIDLLLAGKITAEEYIRRIKRD